MLGSMWRRFVWAVSCLAHAVVDALCALLLMVPQQGGKRAPELWVYIKSKDAFMQVGGIAEGDDD